MSIKRVLWVSRHLLLGPQRVALPPAPAPTDATAGLAHKQAEPGWAPLSAAAASGAAAPLGVMAALFPPKRKSATLHVVAIKEKRSVHTVLHAGLAASAACRQGALLPAAGSAAGARLALPRAAQIPSTVPPRRSSPPFRSRSKASAKPKHVLVSGKTVHWAVLNLTTDRRPPSAPAPAATTASGGVHERRRWRALGIMARSLLLVGALLIAGLPPVALA